MLDLVWLIPAFPLLGFLLLVVGGRKLGEPRAGWLATAVMAGSFVASVIVFFGLVAEHVEERQFSQVLFTWVPAGRFSVDVGFLVDPLSITMCLFITGVGTLIHLYSIGYMHGDEKFSKFFLYLNLFIFSMTLLVLGENLLVTFLGWEGVGTCSYLLISFWHTRESAAVAGKKAFVTNRVGDWGVMLAMFLSFGAVGSVSYSVLNESAESGALAASTATGISILLLVGATGKWIDLTDASTSGLSGMAQQIRDSIDPSAMFAGTGPDSLTVTKGESTTIDGTEATAYRITLDVAAMAQVLGRTLSAEELDQVKAAAGGTSMDVVYYLDAQDRPIRTTVTMGTFMTQEMRYSGFGTQSPITAPAAADVIPASELGL